MGTVVSMMRPTGTCISLSQIGSTNQWTLATNKVYNANDYNVAVYDFIDLISAAGVTVGSYMVTAINTTLKTFTLEINTVPTGTPATWKSKAPYYEHGHYLEIENTLKQKDGEQTFKYQKYPLVVLIQDVKATGGKSSMINSEVSLTMFIVAATNKDYDAEKRKVNKFIPILKPLYFNLLYNIHYCRLFETIDYTQIPHNHIERYFWGRGGEFANEKGIFSDWLDAIEIQNLILKIKQPSQIPTNQLVKFKN